MDKSFWDRIQELRESINGGVQPMAEIRLPTQTIKFALGMYLFQSGFFALWWSVSDHAFFPWMLFMSAFLQVGWFWSKVTESWKYAHYHRIGDNDDLPRTQRHYGDPEQGMGYSEYTTGDWSSGGQSRYQPPEPIYAPSIDIQNEGITGNRPVPLPQKVDPPPLFKAEPRPIQHPLQANNLWDSQND